MHQLPRPAPRSAAPATNPTTNPERTNNSRDPPMPRSRSSVDLSSYTERAGAESANTAGRESTAGAGQDRELTRLNQIIQHFHTKAALMICSARANLPRSQNQQGERRQNKWFNILIDETDVLQDQLQEWRRPDLYEDKPRPLVIEIFLDTAHLTNNQVLVIKDDAGRRHDVANALGSSTSSSPQPSRNGGRHCEVVLERWTIELGDAIELTRAEMDDKLSNVYKKGVVLFRSLYTLLRILPAFKLYRKLSRNTGGHQALKLKFRIRKGRGLAHGQLDSLFTPLSPSEQTSNSQDIVEHYACDRLASPVGPLHCSLSFRRNCLFSVAESEALISDHFSGLDARMPPTPFGRSLPGDHAARHHGPYSSTVASTTTTSRERPRALLGTYGSLGTFHSSDKRGSPVTELRQRALEDDYNDDEMKRVEQIRADEGVPLRKSVDYFANPPFKAGSLASSPRPSPSPSSSMGRNDSGPTRIGGTSATSSKRASLNTLPQQSLRTPSLVNEVAVGSSGSSSPKPAPVRYSSSFANRPRRFTSQSSKTAESNASSGRGSSDSKEKSEHMHEMNPEGVGSAKTDDDDIASFISELERSKDIKFHTPPSNRDNVVNLAKYSSMRDPSTQLAEEMSSSSLIQTSSTPPSRRLSNVPGLSTSSSPSRALTHAPHVRSRLSAHSVAEEASGASATSVEGSSSSPRIREVEEEDDEEPFIFPHHQDDNLD